ncbi:LOW QUALITY PROTEIN: hypothetical protein U9M48_026623, partial [Paspalum notatum var. saurae]
MSSTPDHTWWITTVYGPVVDEGRAAFLQELRDVRSLCLGPWLLCGDFNMILNAADKNNGRLNRRVMALFRRFLDEVELAELHLDGRLFTWSNERVHPTLECIDRAFASVDWLGLFPDHWLRALSSDCSDHAPLLLHTCCVPWVKRRFRFESIWPKFPGFLETVVEAWSVSSPLADPCRLLDIKLRNTAKALQSWSAKFVGSVRLQLAVAREVVLLFDGAQDTRPLSSAEISLRRQLKIKCLRLAFLSRTIARQRSRMIFLAAGDANTKFFHLQACHRNRRNFIHEINVDGHQIALEEDKARAFFQCFKDVFGNFFERSHSLRFDRLGLRSVSLAGLDRCFSEDEVWAVVRELPSEKAPGPDGFTGLFFKTAWPVIKADIMRVFNALWSLDTRSLFLLNDAYLVLLKKKSDAVEIRDFRPISLIHSVCKLLTKVLSTRLAPKLNDLISRNQSAFIKSRCIHDNFRTVQLTCKLLHRRKVPALFLKIDLAKAFDYRNWIAALLSTSSTKLLINGSVGRRICHARGLRQGDPLSPMLFVIVMEALNGLIGLADREGFLSRFRLPSICRALLYADDLVIFLVPSRSDLSLLKSLLEVFAGASGLFANLAKCSATPIACQLEDLALVQQTRALINFPCVYLGIPLSTRKLRRGEEQAVIDKVAAKIPRWKGNLLNLAGRTVLVKSTLSAVPVHAIDKLRRSFLWSGSAVSVQGRCKVVWTRVCRPVEFGGLGITDLHLLGLALRVRWCWLQRSDPQEVWAGLSCGMERGVLDLFRAGSEIILGNGSTALFWVDNWLDGLPLEAIAPNLVKAVPTRFRSRTVREGLLNRAWISDIRGTLTEAMVIEYVEVWEKVQQVTLNEAAQDRFRWRWESDGVYSSASAYRACFMGSIRFLGAKFIWKAKVPPKVKFFAWLAAQDRCWTSERRRRHGLQDDDQCALCDQEVESINHLLLQCSFSRHWALVRKRTAKEFRHGLDAVIILVCWLLWKERNARVFDARASSPHEVLSKILDEARLWDLAGFRAFASLIELLPSFLDTFFVDPPRSPIFD